jgi:hypothetical protein
MNGPYESILLSCLQVTAAATLGLGASWISLRLRPAIAPTLMCTTLIIILTLSLAAPFRLPD